MRPRTATETLAGANRILVFTGAGISTESGIPDFRGPDGLWTRVDPAQFSFGVFMDNPAIRRRCWTILRDERLTDGSVRPNPAHDAIVDLEGAGRLAGCVTQNVDGLHQQAGLADDRVAELHGTAATVVCLDCRAVTPFESLRGRLEGGDLDPHCEICGGLLKPSMVLFGEGVPLEPMERATRWTHTADAVLVVGSTLSIEPAASLVVEAAEGGTPLVIVNQGPTDYDDLADVKLDGPTGTVVPALVAEILNEER
jgi:NAD-dependent deacetylase